jgi:adenylate cyclase class IV
VYEVEYKVEVTEPEKQRLTELFSEKSFVTLSPVRQEDYYIEAKASPLGGYNTKRYRDQGNKIFFTEKTWEVHAGGKVRREIENEVTRKEFDAALLKYTDTIKISKHRQSFTVLFENIPFHIDLDSIKFDHSSGMRYFVEAEVMSQSKEEVGKIRDIIIRFLRQYLERSDLVEAPGMFAMALQKL